MSRRTCTSCGHSLTFHRGGLVGCIAGVVGRVTDSNNLIWAEVVRCGCPVTKPSPEWDDAGNRP